MQPKIKKVGYVAIVGRPNTGKSTFLNALIGEKVSIVSEVPQTTRKSIIGIYNDELHQIIFYDTPGIHLSENIFNKQINENAISSLRKADAVLHLIDSSKKLGEEEKNIEKILENFPNPIIKVFTKSDLMKVLEIPENALKISSKNGEGFAEVISEIGKYLPQGPELYPEDYYTVQETNSRIEEIIREKIFLHTFKEIPHASFVTIEDLQDKKDILEILAYIFVESDSQKGIVIGKKAGILTEIGREARIDLEEIFGKKVFLKLRVKVVEKWRKDEKVVKKQIAEN